MDTEQKEREMHGADDGSYRGESREEEEGGRDVRKEVSGAL